jgi:hypothetical protein
MRLQMTRLNLEMRLEVYPADLSSVDLHQASLQQSGALFVPG